MVESQQVTVFNCISLRKLIWLLVLLSAAFVFYQVLLIQQKQASQLIAQKQAAERELAEQAAAKLNELPEYSDKLITDLFHAMLAPPFNKLDVTGRELDPAATNWQCAQSNDTGLIWEVKTRDGGLRDASYTYSWFAAGDNNFRLPSGRTDGGACLYSDCDTGDYIERVNKQKLCGVSNWRLPTTEELSTIVHQSNYIPKVDLRYFPNAKSYYYWSNTVYANYYDPNKYAHFPGMQAFQYWSEILAINDYSLMTSVNFLNGLSYGARKSRNYHIRLVSGSLSE